MVFPSLKRDSSYLPLHHEEKLGLTEDAEYAHSSSSSSDDSVRPSDKPSRRYSHWIYALVIVLLTSSNIILLMTRNGHQSNLPKNAVFSPAESAIQYKNVVMTSGVQQDLSPYQGAPSEENDKLWEDLYNFRVSEIPMSDAAQMTNKTAPISSRPGYYGVTLFVFHQLHCLNLLRRAIYKNEALPAEGVTEDGLVLYHLDHCIDSLRQSAMCASDITPIPFAWYEQYQSYESYSGITRTCRDYSAVQEWAREHELMQDWNRSVQVNDPLGNTYMDSVGHTRIVE